LHCQSTAVVRGECGFDPRLVHMWRNLEPKVASHDAPRGVVSRHTSSKRAVNWRERERSSSLGLASIRRRVLVPALTTTFVPLSLLMQSLYLFFAVI
jgi:hypothetical protein